MTNLKSADRRLASSIALIACGLLSSACDSQGGEGDVMKGGRGDVPDEQAAADLMTALQEGKPWVCADAGLQQTAVAMISERLDRAIPGDTMPTRVMSTSESLQVAFDAQTKRMICHSEMFTMNGDVQSTQDVTWTAQPTADGFNINVSVDVSQLYSAPSAPPLGG